MADGVVAEVCRGELLTLADMDASQRVLLAAGIDLDCADQGDEKPVPGVPQALAENENPFDPVPMSANSEASSGTE